MPAVSIPTRSDERIWRNEPNAGSDLPKEPITRERPMTPDQRKAVLDILEDAKELTLATVRPDGWPQATVVSFVNDDLTLYFGCDKGSQKAQNLARDPRVSATVTLPYVGWSEICGLSLAGRAERVTEGEAVQTAARLMLFKYPQIAEAAAGADLGRVVLFRLRPVVISHLDYRRGLGWSELIEP